MKGAYMVRSKKSTKSLHPNMHCLQNNPNLCIKTEPVTAGLDAAAYVWIYIQLYMWALLRNQT